VLTFVVAGIALAGLAWVVGVGTESVGARFGPAATGVLQSTLGNLPELFIVLFALGAGETVIAQTSVLGSLFANGLLVLGLAIVAGARRAPDGVMTFSPRLPNDTAVLLLLASFLIVILGVSDRIGDRASRHEVAISCIGAVVLLLIYGAWLVNYLRTGEAAEASLEESPHHLPFVRALGLLAAAGVAAAFVSDWFVAALDPAVKQLGISKAFTGLVIVGIAGNAVENVVGITLAAKGHSDLAVSVVKNSVAQIAVFLFPALVLLFALLQRTPDVRDQPGADERGRALCARGLGDHRRRAGSGLRGLGPRRLLRDPRGARLVRIAVTGSLTAVSHHVSATVGA
jgi:Ca2+:H+ antiporter